MYFVTLISFSESMTLWFILVDVDLIFSGVSSTSGLASVASSLTASASAVLSSIFSSSVSNNFSFRTARSFSLKENVVSTIGRS